MARTPIRRWTILLWLLCLLGFNLSFPVDAPVIPQKSPVSLRCYLPDKNSTIVNLNSCGLASIPEQLKDYQKMRYLSLQKNKIEQIDSGLIAGLKELSGLYLKSNNISEIPNLVSDSIRVLDFSYNNIKEPIHPSKFVGLTKIKTVLLQGNDEEMCIKTQEMSREANLKIKIDCGESALDFVPTTSPKGNSTPPPYVTGEPSFSPPPTPPQMSSRESTPSTSPSPPSLPSSKTPPSLPPTHRPVPQDTTSEGSLSSSTQSPESPQSKKSWITITVTVVIFVVVFGIVFVFRKKIWEYICNKLYPREIRNSSELSEKEKMIASHF